VLLGGALQRPPESPQSCALALRGIGQHVPLDSVFLGALREPRPQLLTHDCLDVHQDVRLGRVRADALRVAGARERVLAAVVAASPRPPRVHALAAAPTEHDASQLLSEILP
jgi:hypothetical protein